jgi:hypothetical protein
MRKEDKGKQKMNRQRPGIRIAMTLAVTGLVLGFGPPASATTMVPLSLDQITSLSDDVVLGRVLYSFSYWTADQSVIVTETHIAVDRYLKSVDPTPFDSPYVTVRQPGGIVKGYGMRTAAAGTFDEDEWVVVFLKQSGDGPHELVGLGQGKFSIVEDSDGNTAVVGSSKAISSVLSTSPAPSSPTIEEEGKSAISLESFERRVRGLAAIQRALKRSERGKAKGLK